ncbi:MAG: UbiD family decarboxylase [Deltaproteobacteria bacterium]|nr:UbiD family decarboxylase [Deltaproteobacteria bacterium]
MDDLRDFIKRAEEMGECKVLEHADWDLEIGNITSWRSSIPNPPVLVFDNIKGYKKGYRVATNLFATNRRTALALGMPLEASGIELVKSWQAKIAKKMELIPPVEVATGPVKENIHLGDEVDLFEFPTPKWHELDGGRYIGTGCMVIMRDPDDGWLNFGTYRVQIHDKSIATVYISPGKQGDLIRKKYWAKGKGCPVAVTCGQAPVLWAASGAAVHWGVSEYEYAGWLINEPIEVTKGVVTDLPIPTSAEIVLEGEIVPPEVDTRVEGPFGEATGYYGSGARPEPVFRVKGILHRNNPILQGNAPNIFHTYTLGTTIKRSARLWTDLDQQIPGVKGVWNVDVCGSRAIIVISLEQKYGGHAKQAALLAAGLANTAYMWRWIIVVDEDIDPSNIAEVLWALATRGDPESVDVIRGCWGTSLDPQLPPEKRARGDLTHSGGIIMACKPYHWMKEFPPSIKPGQELAEKTKAKWSKFFS